MCACDHRHGDAQPIVELVKPLVVEGVRVDLQLPCKQQQVAGIGRGGGAGGGGARAMIWNGVPDMSDMASKCPPIFCMFTLKLSDVLDISVLSCARMESRTRVWVRVLHIESSQGGGDGGHGRRVRLHLLHWGHPGLEAAKGPEQRDALGRLLQVLGLDELI